MSAFGTKFVLVNDVRQVLDPKIFKGGPWVHHATVVRGLKEYMAFSHRDTHALYVEEIDTTDPNLFKKIQDEAEWKELVEFLHQKGLLGISKEIKAGIRGLTGF